MSVELANTSSKSGRRSQRNQYANVPSVGKEKSSVLSHPHLSSLKGAAGMSQTTHERTKETLNLIRKKLQQAAALTQTPIEQKHLARFICLSALMMGRVRDYQISERECRVLLPHSAMIIFSIDGTMAVVHEGTNESSS